MVRNFYEPTPSVDWTKKLEEVYARQTRQLEEHHANLRARDQQMVDKAKAEDITKVFSSLAGFSQAAASLGNKNKERKAEKQKEDFALLRSKLTPQQVADNTLGKIVEDYWSQDKSFRKDKRNLVKLLETHKVEEGSDLYEYILNSSAAEHVNTKKFIGYETLKNSYGEYNTYIDSLKGDDLIKYRSEVKESADAKKQHYKKWVLDKLGVLNFSDKFTYGVLEPELERIANTEGVTFGLQQKGLKLTKDTVKLEADISTLIQDEVNNPGSIATGFSDIISEISLKKNISKAEAKQELIVNLNLSGYNGDFKDHELAASRQGLLVGHPAGDKGEILFTQKDWDFIQAGIDNGNTARTNAHKLEWKGKTSKMIDAVISGNVTKDKYDEFIVQGQANGLTNDKTFQYLQTLDPESQNEGVYISERVDWEPFLTGEAQGSLPIKEMKERAKTIRSGKLKREIEARIKESELRQSTALGSPADFLAASKTKINKVAGKVGLDPNILLEGEAEEIQHLITRKRKWILEQFPATIQGVSDANDAWEDWLTKNGFYVQDNPENPNPGVGILSQTVDGEFNNYKASKNLFNASKVQNAQTPTKKNLANWYLEMHRNYKKVEHEGLSLSSKGRTTKETLIKRKGVLDPEDVVGAFTASPDGGLFISTEVRVKAAMLGVTPSVLIKEQALALKDHPIFKSLGLEKRLADLEEQPDLKINKILAAANQPNVLFKWERGKINSPNSIKQLYIILIENLNKTANQRADEDDKWDTNPEFEGIDVNNVNQDIG